MRYRVGLVCLLLAGTIGACSSAEAAKLQLCQKLYQQYIFGRPSHKAVATTGGRLLASPSTSCGFSYGYSTRNLANSVALRECSRYARKYKHQGKCRNY